MTSQQRPLRKQSLLRAEERTAHSSRQGAAHPLALTLLRALNEPLAGIAVGSIVIAMIVVLASGSQGSDSGSSARVVTVYRNQTLTSSQAASRPPARAHSAPRSSGSSHPGTGGAPLSPAKPKPASHPTRGRASLAREVGQLVIATYTGTSPPATMLSAVEKGQVGAVILMGDNTAGGASSVAAAARQLQAAARRGRNPRLLIMTDQEGGDVLRLASGPPAQSAYAMGLAGDARSQGFATGQFLRSVGVNVDLAPVADVVRAPTGFINEYHRSFGSNPGIVERAACGFALGLEQAGVAFTLKHFPGLGDAIQSTDNVPVSMTEPANEIQADDAAYRACGSARLALVMISSAAYPTFLGSATPAVLSPLIYQQVLPADNVTALPISDSFESGAISAQVSPALRAINAGLDMVMYPGYESTSASAYRQLLIDAESERIPRVRLDAAYARILRLKHDPALQ